MNLLSVYGFVLLWCLVVVGPIWLALWGLGKIVEGRKKRQAEEVTISGMMASPAPPLSEEELERAFTAAVEMSRGTMHSER